MDKDFKRFTDFLIGMGIEQVLHTHKSYLAHLIAVFDFRNRWRHERPILREGRSQSIRRSLGPGQSDLVCPVRYKPRTLEALAP
jgi:hypothetical protein